MSRSSIPQADLAINLSEGRFYAGSDLEIEVIVVPQESFYAHRGEIELVHTETYWFHKPYDFSFEVRNEPAALLFMFKPIFKLIFYLLYKANIFTDTWGEYEERVIHREPFLTKEELSSGVPHRRTIRFSLHSDTPASQSGNTQENPARSRSDCNPQVTWHVRARLYYLKRRSWLWRWRRPAPTLLHELKKTAIVYAPPNRSSGEEFPDYVPAELQEHEIESAHNDGDAVQGTPWPLHGVARYVFGGVLMIPVAFLYAIDIGILFSVSSHSESAIAATFITTWIVGEVYASRPRSFRAVIGRSCVLYAAAAFFHPVAGVINGAGADPFSVVFGLITGLIASMLGYLALRRRRTDDDIITSVRQVGD